MLPSTDTTLTFLSFRYHTYFLSSSDTTLTFCLPQIPHLLFVFHRYHTYFFVFQIPHLHLSSTYTTLTFCLPQIPHLLFIFHRYHTYFVSSTDTTLTFCLPQILHLLFVLHRYYTYFLSSTDTTHFIINPSSVNVPVYKKKHKWHMAKICGWHRATLQNYKATWTSLPTNEKTNTTSTRRLLRLNRLQTWFQNICVSLTL